VSTEPIQSSQHHVQLDQFEGPLDLLLFLIRKSEINIYDIPIHEITEQYLSFLDYATGIDLDHITEFYALAATLLLIKSKMLLPVEFEDDEDFEDPRRELVEQLIEYQRFKKLTDLMTEQQESTEWIIEPRQKQGAFDFVDDDEMWEQIEVWDLFQSFSKIMRNLSSERIVDLYEEVSINQKLSLLSEMLDDRGELAFDDLVTKPDSPMDVICAFLAVLEAAKTIGIAILQNRLFGDIRIRKRARPVQTETQRQTSGGENGA
jgi:segregation and condensation protein A